MEEYLCNFFISQVIPVYKKDYNTTKGNLKEKLPQKNPDAVSSACRLLQYCQIPGKNSSDI
jgi:hypothetical protein